MTKRTKTLILSILSVLIILGLCIPVLGAENPILIRIAFVSPIDSDFPYPMAAKKFKAEIEEETNGRVKVQLFGGGQLGGERDTIEALQLGTIEAVFVANAPLSAWSKKAMLWDLPFIFRDYDHGVKVLNSDIEQEIVSELENVGITELGVWISDDRNVYTKNKAIYKVDDLKGIKIRVMESPVHIDTFNALGAIATPLNFNELYTALQQGVVDGAENSTSSFWISKHGELCKYYSFTHHFLMPAHFLMAKKFFDNLPADIREIVDRLGAEAGKYAGVVARKGWDKDLGSMKEAGIHINEVENIAEFRAKVQPVYDKYEELLGDLIRRVDAIK